MNSTDALYAVRAKHQGEVLAHCVTRTAFLRHIVADARTRDLFAYWGQSTGVDVVVDEMSALLDAAAHLAGLAHRSALRKHDHAVHLVGPLGSLQRLEEQYERLLAQTQEERARFAIGFVVAELFGTTVDDDVPIRAWLANDLLTIFRWEIAGHVYGERVPLVVGLSPAAGPFRARTQRPNGKGARHERNAT
jgi:hypothetical protein